MLGYGLWIIWKPYFYQNRFFQGGDCTTKRVKFDQETEGKVNEETYPNERCGKDQEQYVDALKESVNSNVPSVARTEKSGFDQLPKELNEMKIGDDKGKNNNKKVFIVIHFLVFF